MLVFLANKFDNGSFTFYAMKEEAIAFAKKPVHKDRFNRSIGQWLYGWKND